MCVCVCVCLHACVHEGTVICVASTFVIVAKLGSFVCLPGCAHECTVISIGIIVD